MNGLYFGLVVEDECTHGDGVPQFSGVNVT
jgi:hypothetical protein